MTRLRPVRPDKLGDTIEEMHDQYLAELNGYTNIPPGSGAVITAGSLATNEPEKSIE